MPNSMLASPLYERPAASRPDLVCPSCQYDVLTIPDIVIHIEIEILTDFLWNKLINVRI